MRKFIYGGDTETIRGEPMTMQFYSKHAGVDDLLWVGDPEDAAAQFLKWCKKLRVNAQHVIYVHNLNFDMVSFFWDIKDELVVTDSGEFDFTYEGWRVTGVYGAPTFARLTDKSSHRSVMLVDSFSYYRASLEKAAEVFCPHLPKLKRPEGLGQRRFTKRDLDFCAYAMRDAEVAYYIGLALEALHDEFDLSQTVSVADMAARIFRHSYLERTIPQPSRPIMEAALNSYHGGKNNLAVAPGWYQNVSSLDISSAYPDAMARMPSFYEERLYRKFRLLNSGPVPEWGIYQVSGNVADCKWPTLFAHNFVPLRGEYVENVCVTGFELNEAMRAGEFKVKSCVGWFYDAEKDRNDPPLKHYCHEFYARKEAEKDKAKRAMYKFLLNSISGKFIQTRKQEKLSVFNIDDETMTDSSDLIAGGMFHPFIASLITGHTRARMHQLEHKYEALHTATDGIFTQKRITMKPQTGLGAVVNEAQGDLLLLRNKLYILYGAGPGDGVKVKTSAVFPDRHIIKAALHGFAGSVADLERLATSGQREYTAKRVNKLRSSLKRGLTPNEFRDQDFFLNVGRLPVHRA